MKSHASHLETHIAKAERSGKISHDLAEALRFNADEIRILRETADMKEKGIWNALERREEG